VSKGEVITPHFMFCGALASGFRLMFVQIRVEKYRRFQNWLRPFATHTRGARICKKEIAGRCPAMTIALR
jgi:hypothetical protein